MTRILPLLAAIAGVWLVSASGAQAQASAADRCDQLVQQRDPAITQRLSAVPDAPTLVETADILPPKGDLPEVCHLIGHIAPDIGFEMRMPTTAWNGKFLMQGCGGYCGSLAQNQPEPALARGYAVIVSDMGHTSKGWIFAYNNPQGEMDFGFRSTHVTAQVAKTLIDLYYGRPPAFSYFNGCSTGGRQAFVEAQRFPHDFNGIIGGAPPYNETGDRPLSLYWNARVNMGKDGKPLLTAEMMPFLHAAVMKACDALDGLKDGILQNPEACKWDPAAIVCGAQGVAADKCLSPEQAEVVRKFYSGAVNSKGEQLYFGMTRGSEWNWAPDFVGAAGKHGANLGGVGQPQTALMSYLSFFHDPGPGYDPATFDYDRDPDRMAMMEALYGATNPDLRRFKAAGGKLIGWHGWDDNQIPAKASVDYYQTATRTMGGEGPTREFFRLFMTPTTGHCAGGSGGSEVDYLTAIENWVEKGQAPDVLTLYHTKNEAYLPRPHYPLKADAYDRTRPIYPYPDSARYSGKGDPALAASWVKAPRPK